jgi:YidC/Oxa1 family membrane protein insertase
MRHAPFFGWIQDLSAPDPTSVFNLFGLIAWQPPQPLIIGVWPCLMLMTMLAQRSMQPPPQDKTQAMMIYYMPWFMTYIMSKFAAGLVIYWTFSAMFAGIQQYVIMRSMGVEVKFFGKSSEDRKMEKAVKEGPSVHPEAEVIEDEIEEAMFGHEEEPQKPITPPKHKKKKKKK